MYNPISFSICGTFLVKFVRTHVNKQLQNYYQGPIIFVGTFIQETKRNSLKSFNNKPNPNSVEISKNATKLLRTASPLKNVRTTNFLNRVNNTSNQFYSFPPSCVLTYFICKPCGFAISGAINYQTSIVFCKLFLNLVPYQISLLLIRLQHVLLCFGKITAVHNKRKLKILKLAKNPILLSNTIITTISFGLKWACQNNL